MLLIQRIHGRNKQHYNINPLRLAAAAESKALLSLSQKYVVAFTLHRDANQLFRKSSLVSFMLGWEKKVSRQLASARRHTFSLHKLRLKLRHIADRAPGRGEVGKRVSLHVWASILYISKKKDIYQDERLDEILYLGATCGCIWFRRCSVSVLRSCELLRSIWS